MPDRPARGMTGVGFLFGAAVSPALSVQPRSLRDLLPDLGRRCLVMGILNVTPDSFSDGGRFEKPEAAREQANCSNVQINQLQFRNRANSQRVNAQLIFKG